MQGIEIYNRDTKNSGEYSQLLGSLYMQLGPNVLLPLLEKADKAGKKLHLEKSLVSTENDDIDISIDNITFI